MAFLFGDSFAHYLATDIGKKWTTVTVNGAIISPEYALAPAPLGFLCAGTAGNQYLDRALGATHESFVAGFYFRLGTVSVASTIAAFLDGTTEHVSLRYTTSGNLTFTRNATVLATSTNQIALNTWYHIEIKATIGDAADSPSGRYEVRVNGTATNWIPDSGTGQDTRNGGNKSISNVRIYGRAQGDSSANTHRFAHYYVLSQSGAPSDFLGPCRFEVLRPAGVGASADWSGNYADNWRNVADASGDSDETFNQSATAGHTDTFEMSDVVSGTVHAVQHVLMARQDAGAQRSVRPISVISSTEYTGTTFNTSASYEYLCDPVSLSPATSSAWTDSEINAAEFGYELVS